MLVQKTSCLSDSARSRLVSHVVRALRESHEPGPRHDSKREIPGQPISMRPATLRRELAIESEIWLPLPLAQHR
jgi:hypothetical protein